MIGTMACLIGGNGVTANVAKRVTAWRSLAWSGVVGSVLAWAWVWFRVPGAYTLVMFVIAVAAVLFAYRGMQGGMRVAMAGLVMTGFVLFLASLYTMAMLFVNGGQVTAVDVVTVGFFPMVFALLMLVGAAVGFRHVSPSATSTTSTTATTNS